MSLSQFSRRFLLSSLALSALCVGGCGEGAIPGIPGDVSTKLTEGVEEAEKGVDEAEGVVISAESVSRTYFTSRFGNNGKIKIADLKIGQDHRLSGITVRVCTNLGASASVWLFKNGNRTNDIFKPVGITGAAGCSTMRIDRDFRETAGPNGEVWYRPLEAGPGTSVFGVYLNVVGTPPGEHSVKVTFSDFVFFDKDLENKVKVTSGPVIATDLNVTNN